MSSLFNLSNAPLGKRLSIRRLTSSPEMRARLREMGLYENAVIRCISRNNVCLICEIYNTRIGLNATAAGDIVVSQTE